MRHTGYRVVKTREEFDVEVEIEKVIDMPNDDEYYIFTTPIVILADDVLTVVTDEEIKAGRHVNECIGYSVNEGQFDHFLVKLT